MSSLRVRGGGVPEVAVLLIAFAIVACGDDESGGGAGAGCTTDVQCKGDRVCVDQQCVDPDGEDADAGAGTSGSAAGGGGGGTGGTKPPKAGSGPIDDPELEEACSLNCEARHAAGCSMNIGSLDQCVAQCLVIDEQNYGFCHEEQTAQYACLASGGYTCFSGYPQQKSTCVGPNQALLECGQKAPCRAYCERKDSKCGESDADCLTECLADQKGFNDDSCGHYYTQLVTCWSQNLTCADGVIASGSSCDAALAEVADCFGRRNHECDGFCWAAEQLGCGSESCVTDCKAKADDTYCGHYYRSILDCATGSRSLNMQCEDGSPTMRSECMSSNDSYAMCLASH